MSNTRETILENLFGELNNQMFERRLSMVSVEFSERMTSAAGRYFPQRKLIRLSAPYLRLHGWDKCRNTLIHERPEEAIRPYAGVQTLPEKTNRREKYLSSWRYAALWPTLPACLHLPPGP